MTRPANGGPAFPTTEYYDERPYGIADGMTLRDYFAGQALVGYLAMHAGDSMPGEIIAARWAYAYADAMLAERAK